MSFEDNPADDRYQLDQCIDEIKDLQSQIATLTAERDEARKEVESERSYSLSMKSLADECSRNQQRQIETLTAELAALKSCPADGVVIEFNETTDKVRMQNWQSEWTAPEMGEVDALNHQIKDLSNPYQNVNNPHWMRVGDYLEKLKQLAVVARTAQDLARRAIASHAQEKQRADEAERLLKWWVNTMATRNGFGVHLDAIATNPGTLGDNAREILAICGKGDG